MLRRLIQRPSTRFAAAAAWPSIPSAQLHGSSRRLQSPSSSSQPEPDDRRNDDVQATTKKTPSLFEQLFPDEARQTRTQQLDGLSRNAFAAQTLDEPPPLTAPISDEHFPADDADREHRPTHDPKRPGTRTSPPTVDNPLRAQSMLILSAASKQLLESDFVRLGRRGAHVEGWVAGIQRVVQARDPDTLQPLGHYFVLFDSDAAAAAYRHVVDRLWQLAKAGAARRAPPGPGPGRNDVKAFTLVPPSQRYYLLQSEARGSRPDDFDLGGASFVDRLMTKAGSRHLVLVTVDGGRLSADTLRRAIEDDGAARHLPWRVAGLGNILPFGKSVLKKHDRDGGRDIRQSLLDQVDRAMGERRDEGDQEAAAGEGYANPTTTTTTATVGDGRYRQYPRFIVPFADAAEAHRFVRNWHRRQLKLRMHIDDEEQVSWDETRIFNASVLW